MEPIFTSDSIDSPLGNMRVIKTIIENTITILRRTLVLSFSNVFF